MKYIGSFLFVVLVSGSLPAFAQQSVPAAKSNSAIVGVWQADTSTVGSGLMTNWRFYKDGRFSYSPQDALNPILSISGTYFLAGDKGLYLKIKAIRQLTGYKIVPQEQDIDIGIIRIEGRKDSMIRQNSQEYDFHTVKFLGAAKKKIQIDNVHPFFKVSGDPDEYQ